MMRNIVLDIEGTIAPISFVHDVLFPYARAHLADFIARNRAEPEVAAELAAIPGKDPLATLLGWMDVDAKIGPLKALQGMIWREGFTQGALRSQLYPDVAPTLRQWHAAGHRLYIYSSGSVEAQKLLLAHSEAEDLCPLFSGFFDTNVGGKREEDSYRSIAKSIGSAECIFLSDIEPELDAAASAGWQTIQIVRPEDKTIASSRHVQWPRLRDQFGEKA